MGTVSYGNAADIRDWRLTIHNTSSSMHQQYRR
jgi:hypothetical protein